MKERAPLAVEKFEDDGGARYAVFFRPDELPRLASALAKAGQPVSGHAVEAVMTALAEKGDPPWAEELHFDSEGDLFSVDCRRRAPLALLVRRLEKRLADPAALRRLMKSVPFDTR